MSVISSIRSAFLSPKEIIGFWTGKEKEEVTLAAAAVVTLGAVAWPLVAIASLPGCSSADDSSEIDSNDIRIGFTLSDSAAHVGIPFTMQATLWAVQEDGTTEKIEDTDAYTGKWSITDGEDVTELDGLSATYTWENIGDPFVQFSLYDQGGNFIISKEVDICTVVDSETPSAVIGNLEYTYYVGDTAKNIIGYTDQDAADVSLEWEITPPDGTVKIILGSTIPSYTFDQSGDYDFRLRVTNTASGASNSELRSVGVYETSEDAPSGSLVSVPYSATVNEEIEIAMFEPDHTLYSYSINWGDGSADTLASGESTFPLHAYAATGIYSINVRVESLTNPANYITLTHTITITDTPVPMPSISASHISGDDAGYSVYFNATASYSPIDAAITSYTLYYGDGDSETNSSGIFLHTYPDLGAGGSAAYTAYLIVTDEYGQYNSTTLTVSTWDS
ncbi:MAG: PKD domain-containing protein [Candidatus Margulisbacteria bacterium]|nr:PKD domain-containing protein [Candidatus Margulisiibacteriota bacterium]